ACIFIARRAVIDLPHRVEPDKRSLVPVLPQSDRLDRRPDRTGLTAMFVHHNLWTFPGSTKTCIDKVDLGFDDGQVVLRPALQNKSRSEIGEIRNARDVEENILRQNGGEPGKNFFRAPTLSLEVDDVGLHKNSAAISENGHALSRERSLCELLNGNIERLRG